VPDSQECGDTESPKPPVNGPRTGFVCLGHHDGGDRYAVWAELIDKTRNTHVIFVDVHTVSGTSSTASRERGVEIQTLFDALGTINADGLPVVFAGDFNSNKSRSNDAVATVMHHNGYYDAYDQAGTLNRQHINSYNDFSVIPKISYTWGDHVDHVWVVPSKTRVISWRNGALIVNGRLTGIIPSDHSPVVVDVRLN
jgi:endonuclease/exonuclease/phosphatase family metal-dependent hydrolase